MKIGKIPPEWFTQQQELSCRAIIAPLRPIPRYLAGADIAFSLDGARAVAVAIVWDRRTDEIVDRCIARQAVKYPYVPGFLSFREGPVLTEAIAGLTHHWDVICFDGQGLAHPRGCGLATHLGVTLDRPSIGMAKSCLCGEFVEPAARTGSHTPLKLEGKTIGSVLRTRDGVKPIFISIGHRVNLPSARRIALASCRGYRIPQPTRLADILTRVHRAQT